jgi:hypothetical protein
MKSKRAFTSAVAMVAIASLAAFGCSKDKKKKKGETPAKGKTAGKEKVAAKPGAARAATGSAGAPAAAGSFAKFPKDSNIVLGITGDKLRSSTLLKPLLPKLTARAGKGLAKMKECGVDVVGGLKTAAVGMNQKTEKGVFELSGFTKAQFDACAKKAKEDGKKITVTHDGNFTTVKDEKGEELLVRWTGTNTMLGGPKGTTKADLDAAASGKGGLDSNADMMALLSKVDASAAVYFAMQMPPEKQKTPMGTLKGAYGSINFDAGIKLNAGAQMASADEAKKAVDKANQQMGAMKSGPFGKFLNKLVLKADGANVAVQLQLSDAEVKELTTMIMQNPMLQMLMKRGMGGGMGGGMGAPGGGGGMPPMPQ